MCIENMCQYQNRFFFIKIMQDNMLVKKRAFTANNPY